MTSTSAPKTHSSRTVRGGLVLFCLLCLSAKAAAIKVKSGEVHEGKIQGVIVLKGGERETPSEQDPSKTVYTASYTVINGSDITAIDAKGVHHASQPFVNLDVTQEGDSLDDLDVVSRGMKIKPGPAAFGTTKSAGALTRLDRPAGQVTPTRSAVLGDYREQAGNTAAEIRPMIEIETAKGMVKVPVADLVPLAPE